MATHRIGILTGGGDAPGLNTVIRAVVKYAVGKLHWQVVGIEDSFNGLLDAPRRLHDLTPKSCQGILHRGGTILSLAHTTLSGVAYHDAFESNVLLLGVVAQEGANCANGDTEWDWLLIDNDYESLHLRIVIDSAMDTGDTWYVESEAFEYTGNGTGNILAGLNVDLSDVSTTTLEVGDRLSGSASFVGEPRRIEGEISFNVEYCGQGGFSE